ncbi:MAG: putative Ig domain-containing protein [Candidatus Hydrogenedentes bacterium]|nr:putative Ig domain-containing protein [Candidatus Hydrogenedentota bacterium]
MIDRFFAWKRLFLLWGVYMAGSLLSGTLLFAQSISEDVPDLELEKQQAMAVKASFDSLIAREKAMKAAGIDDVPLIVPYTPPPRVAHQLPGMLLPPESVPKSSAAETKAIVKSPAPTAAFPGILTGSIVPPDPNGAVGPNHLMVTLNDRVRIQSKDGTVISTVTLNTFWSPLGSLSIFDPKAIFDPSTGRFYFVACAQPRSASSKMVFAVSETDDPTGNWFYFQFTPSISTATSSIWADYPNMGFTKDWITLSYNIFYTASPFNFVGINILAINKATALDGGAVTFTRIQSTSVGGTLVPAITYDATESTQWIVQNSSPALFGNGLLRLYKITGNLGSEAFTVISARPTSTPWNNSPIGAPQLSVTNLITTNDDRVINAVLRNGSLWAVQHVGLPALNQNHVGIKWWEVNPAAATSIQTGNIEGSTYPGGDFYYFPSVAINKDNEAFMGFSGSSATKNAGCYYAFRAPSSPAGTFEVPIQYKAGEGGYTQSRWGDYSNTFVDPADDKTFWTIQMFAESSTTNNRWGTYWAKLTPGGGAPDNINPAVNLAAPASSTKVRVTFSEPMADNTNLINPAFYTFLGGNGGVSAQSVTRVDPSKVDVTVNEMTNGASYTAVVNTSGPVDLAGNAVAVGSNSASFLGLGGGPSAVINLDNVSPTNADSVSFSVDFSEAVAPTFTAADVTVTGSLAGGATVAVTGADPIYTVTVTPSNPNASGTIGITVGTAVTDASGNSYGGGSSPLSYTIDNSAATIAVNTLATTDTTPNLSGTINDSSSTVSITVAGQTRAAANNGNGTWSLAGSTLSALADGTYNVVASATDSAGNVGTDGTTNELRVDTTPPTIGVNPKSTADNTPSLSGTVNDTTATIQITVSGQIRAAVNNGNGTWTLADGALTALADGTYNVIATATDSLGNAGADGSTNELTIDAAGPVITVNAVSTSDRTPALSGSINDPSATVSILVAGQTRTATNNGSTWSVADNSLLTLSDGTYNVEATATDAVGNSGTDATTNELLVDGTAPVAGVNALLTNDSTPTLAGTVNDAGATISVTIGAQTRTATNNGVTWTLNGSQLTALPDGTYNVSVTATDSVGNSGSDSTTNEVVIDTVAPALTVATKRTNDSTPSLNGTVTDPAATIQVVVSGQTVSAVNAGNGTWNLPDGTLAPLAQGTFSVTVTARDAANNTGTDPTSSELQIDLTAPVITVNSLTTSDTTPALSGSLNDAAATIQVTVNGQTLSATNNGTTWSLANNALSELPNGIYNVTARATDDVGNIGQDATQDELIVDNVAPVVTVNTLATRDNTPPLSGTINDPTAVIQVVVSGQTRTATNSGTTWSVPNNSLTTLANGIFNVQVTATDGAGNAGADATTNELTIDAAPPTAVIALDNSTPTNANFVGFSVDFNETVAPTFTVADVQVTGTLAGAASASVSGSGPDYTVTVTPTNPNADGTIGINVIGSGVRDVLGNVFGGASSPQSYTIDNTAPTVTVNSLVTNDTTPALSGTVNDATATIQVVVGGQTRAAVNNGATWSLADNSLNALSNGTFNVQVTATDGSGNVGSDATASELTVDAVPLTVVLSLLDPVNTNLNSVRFGAAFNKSVGSTFTAADVTVGSPFATAGVAISGSGAAYTVTVTPSNANTNGVLGITLGTAVNDAAGNTLAQTPSSNYTIDNTAPTVGVTTLSTSDSTPALSGTVNDATAAISVTVGSQTHTATNNGATWTLANDVLSALADGTYNVAATATDAAGNVGADATSNELRVDTTAPTAAIALDNPTPTNANAVAFSVDFSESVGGTFTSADVTVTGAFAGAPVAVTGSNPNFTVTVTPANPNADGALGISVGAAITDSVGNAFAGGSSPASYTLDNTAPTVTVTALSTSDSSPALSGTINDPAATVSVNVNGQINAATNNGSTWTLAGGALTALPDATYDVQVTATDTVGNAGSDATANELVIDSALPIVTVNALRTSDNTPALTGTINDAAATITVTVDGQVNVATNNGATWTLADNTLTALPDGTYNVAVSAEDVLNNIGTDNSTNELIVDTVAPTATITRQNPAVTNFNAVAYSVQFSESVGTSFTGADVTPSGVAAAVAVTGTDPNYTVTLTPGNPNANGAIGMAIGTSVTDLAGNAFAGATAADYTLDNTAPAVTVNTLSTNDATPALSGTVNDATATITVTVDGQVRTATNNGATWSLANNTLTTLANGTYNVAVAAVDPAGNSGSDATSGELVVNTIPLTAAITLTGANPTSADSLTFGVLFNKSANNTFTNADITVTGALAAGATSAVSGSGATFTVTVTPASPTADGTIGISIGTGVSDVFGNTLAVTPSPSSYTLDNVAPTAVIALDDSSPTNLDTVSFSVNFSKNVAPTFTGSDITLGGTLAAGATVGLTGSDPNYTVSVTPSSGSADGTLSINVGTAVQDAVGNSFAGGSSAAYSIDNTAPAVTVTPLITTDNTPALTGTIDDTAASVQILVGGQTIVAANNGNGTWTLADNALAALANGEYNVTVTATDAVGNTSTDATTGELRVDTVAPTAVIAAVSPLNTNLDAIVFSVDFSEPVSPTFGSGDITVTGAALSPATTVNVDVSGTDPNYLVTLTPADPNASSGNVNIQVGVTVTDPAGNAFAGGTAPAPINLDNVAPGVTVTALSTNDNTPQLTGTVDDVSATVTVSVGGQLNLSATIDNLTNTWTLPNGALSALSDGTYDVTATATDAAGNSSTDGTANELTIDATAPVVTVAVLETNDSTPSLTGTVTDDSTTVLSVQVAGQTIAAINNGNGTWTAAPAAIGDGVYDVGVTATDAFGNVGADATTNELRVDSVPLTAAVSLAGVQVTNADAVAFGVLFNKSVGASFTSGDLTLTGTLAGGVVPGGVALTGSGASYTVTLTPTSANANGTLGIAIGAGIQDAAGNTLSGSPVSDLYTIDNSAPVVTVAALQTRDSTPPLMGTVNDATAVISVSVGGQTLSATNAGASWIIGDGALSALADGTYNVQVTATDAAGNSGTDGTTGELFIDTGAPTATLNTLSTSDSSPALTGSIDDPAASLTVTVSGQTINAAIAGNAWSTADNALNPLADADYDVTLTATDTLGNTRQNIFGSALTVNTTGAMVMVDFLVTNDTTPDITGTVDDAAATVSVTVAGQTAEADNLGNGRWELPGGAFTPLAEGVYDVAVTVTDANNNVDSDSTIDELTIDTTPPVVGVNNQGSNQASPAVVGTVDDPDATVLVTINEETLGAVNGSDGTWTLVAGVLAPLAEGQYEVQATATDAAGNIGSDTTTNELSIDFSVPLITVNTLTTGDTTPPLSGSISDTSSTIFVSVGGQALPAVNNGDGTWTLPDNALTPLAEDVYNVNAVATDGAGNTGADETDNELTIDTSAPAVTVAAQTTTDTTPPLNGTVTDGAASISITVSGQTRAAVNNGNGTWTLPDNSLSPLDQGAYDVEARVTDFVGNMGLDVTANELVVDISVPVVTIDTVVATDNSPPLSGTVDKVDAVVQVNVGDQTVNAVNGGEGIWTLADNVLQPLADGVYDVRVTATKGNTGTDNTINELTIDTVSPQLSIGAPSANTTRSQPVSFTLNYTGVTEINLTVDDILLFSEFDPEILITYGEKLEHTPDISGTVMGDVTITGTGLQSRVVTISNIVGDGLMGIAVAAGTAHDIAGNPAPDALAETLVKVDNTAPEVRNLNLVSDRVFNVIFSERVSTAALNPANYTLSGTGRGNLAAQPDSVQLLENATYQISWNSGELLSPGTVTITAANLFDLAGNPLGDINSASALLEGVGERPFITNVAVTGSRAIEVTYSEPMGNGVTTAANYTLAGTGLGSLPASPSNVTLNGTNVYNLTFSAGEMRRGGNITVTVQNAFDLAGNNMGTPNNGTAINVQQGTGPSVSQVQVQDTTHVDVIFSEAMGPAAIAPQNYTISGDGVGTFADRPDAVTEVQPNRFRLAWNSGDMRNGGDITITASGVADVAGNPIGTQNAGTAEGAAVGIIQTFLAPAIKDNTLYETPDGSVSNGIGPHLYTGQNAGGILRRGLLAFDVTEGVPAGSEIVEVNLHLSTSTGAGGAQAISLYHLQQNWGEGLSDASASGDDGAAPEAGDATWIHSFFDSELWVNPGGDTAPDPVATAMVNETGRYTWSSPEMIDDVSEWLNDPAQNFGWLLGGNETDPDSVKRFDSRENGTIENRPELEVLFVAEGLVFTPILSGIGDRDTEENALFSIELSATDPTEDGVVFSVDASDLPPVNNAFLSDAGDGAAMFTWQPRFGDEGAYTLTFRVANATSPALIDEETITVTVANRNAVPDLSVPPAQSVMEGSPLNFNLFANDADLPDTLSFGMENAPQGATVNAQTGAFSWTPGYEQAGVYEVTFTVTDDGVPPESDTGTVTITVVNLNRAPSVVPIGNQSVAELETLTFSVQGQDPDLTDTFRYSALNLPPGATFSPIIGLFSWAPTFTQQGDYTVTFTVFDSSIPSLSAFEVITITVADVNNAPSTVFLAPATIAEDAPLNTQVGVLTNDDPDASDRATYALVAGDGSQDNSLFFVENDRLRLAAPLNFEQRSLYQVRVRTTDGFNISAENAFTITLTNANDKPTALQIDSTSILENSAIGTDVGTFTTTDEDTADVHTYTFVNPPADLPFAIAGNKLQVATPINHEIRNVYNFQVMSDDGHEGAVTALFTINALDANDPPAGIMTSAGEFAENLPVRTVVATLAALDDDRNDTHGFSLVAGAGDDDNDGFIIENGQLLTLRPFNFEAGDTAEARIRVTDSANASFEQAFVFNVINRNDVPAAVNISNNFVPLEFPAGTAVGTFSTVDEDATDTYVYTLVSGAGDTHNASFTINGSVLLTAVEFPASASGPRSIRVQSRDALGAIVQQAIALTVADDDTDDDGLSDRWELGNFGNLNSAPGDDADNDGLTNLREFQLQTNPNAPDSDDDGVSDMDETSVGSDPVNDQQTPPVLTVSSETLAIGGEGGSREIAIMNAGASALNWSAAILSGDFLSISSATAGIGDGSITVLIEENLAQTARTGTVRIADARAARSPLVITVNQSGCTLPGVAGNVTASDGGEIAGITITWTEADDAGAYEVYRNISNDFASATRIATVETLSYLDTAVPDLPEDVAAGCFAEASTAAIYYWIRAVNDCGAGAASEPDVGTPGGLKRALLQVYENALPASRDESGRRILVPDSVLALRLHHQDGIDPATVWGEVSAPGYTSGVVRWAPAGDYGQDGWVLHESGYLWVPGEEVQFRAGALTLLGEAVLSGEIHFFVADAPLEAGKSGVESAAELRATLTEAARGLPPLAGASAESYALVPDAVYEAPRRVWLPVPAGVDAATLYPWYYYATDSGHEAWYPASAVSGWLVPDSMEILEEDGQTYYGMLVNHGGTMQLATLAEFRLKTDGASALPMHASSWRNGGDLLLYAIVLAGLAWVARLRRTRGATK